MYANLGGGSHTFLVRAIDPSGNTDATPVSRTWNIDITPPTTTIASGPSGPVASTSASFSFTAGEAGSTFQCSLNASPFSACSSPQAYAGLGQGPHTFRVQARDPYGNTDLTPATRNWTADTVAPDTVLDSGPSGPTGNSVSFTFHSNEPGTSFQCKADAGAFSLCTSPAPFPGLADGQHTVLLRAVDAAGNADPSPVSVTWVVDTVAPDTTITTGPAGTVANTSASFAFSGEAGASFECKLDAAPSFTACNSGIGYTNLAQGPHNFQVRAKDAAGNFDATPASRSWTVDTVGPDTTVSGGPSGTVASTSASFLFTASEAGATFVCRLDGAPSFTSCSSGIAYDNLAQGAHTFQVRARDAIGNLDPTPATRTWIVDTVAPNTSAGGPSGTVVNNAATLSLSSGEAGATFECRLDGGAYAGCASPKAYTKLPAGQHTVQVRARDAAGNLDATPAIVSWTIALGVHTPGAVSCAAGGLLTAAAPTAYGNDHTAAQLVAWRVDFYHYDGTTWQLAASGPLLAGSATHTTPVATWYDSVTGAAVGSTAQVIQTHQAIPPGGAWLTVNLFYYLTVDHVAQGFDYLPGTSSTGPNAYPGGACYW